MIRLLSEEVKSG